MTAERRSNSRCPMCQGPATADEKFPEGVRCRNSACRHNHQNELCPRCHAKAVVQAVWKHETWQFTCGDCENTWNK